MASKLQVGIRGNLIAQKRSICQVGIVGTGLVGSDLVDQVGKYGPASMKVVGVADIDKMVTKEGGLDISGGWKPIPELDASATVADTDLDKFTEAIKKGASKAVIVDVTASQFLANKYPGWLSQGISVITPNKKAGAADINFYKEVKGAAASGKAFWGYEVTVGAGLPIIKTCQDLVITGDKVTKIEGIFSGTLSYIFNTMKGGMKFSEVVEMAKNNGFTEPDPRDDLGGVDVQRKTLILARECGMEINMEDVPVESLVPEPLRDFKPKEGEVLADAFIEALKPFDDIMAKKVEEAGDGCLRYVGTIDKANGKAYCGLGVYPSTSPFFGTQHADNIVLYNTERYTPRPLVVQGPGAGAAVTAAGVFAQILDVVPK